MVSEPQEAGQWRVFSNGLPNETKIISPDGRDVTALVRGLTFNISPAEMGELNLDIMPSGVTVVARDVIVHFDCPKCGEAIEHACTGKAPF